jgi:hypothetical protein
VLASLAVFLVGLATAAEILVTVEEPAGQVGFYAANSGASLGKAKVGSLPHEIVLTSDGRTGYVTCFGLHDYASPTGYAGYYVSVIDVKLMLERSKLFIFQAGPGASNTTVQRAPHGMKLSPDERFLWVNSEVTSADGVTVVPSLIVFNLSSSNEYPSQVIPLPTAATQRVHNFVWSPNGQDLWLQLGAFGISKYTPSTNTFSPNYLVKGTATSVVGARGLVFAPNGYLIVSGVGEILELDVSNSTSGPVLVRRMWASNWLVNQFLYPTVTSDNELILVPSTNGQIFIIDYATGTLRNRIDVFGLDPVMVVPDNTLHYAYATAARGGAVTKIDIRGGNFGATSEVMTGVNAGPNGLAIAYISGNVRSNREEFNVVAVLSLSPPVPGSLAPNGAALTNGQPNGYRIKSTFEMWKENVNQAGGIPYNGNTRAAEVVVKYVDDFSNYNLTNSLLIAALEDDDVNALFVADLFFTPSAALLARLAATRVPLLSVYPLYSTVSKRDVAEDGALFKRQVNAATVGYDRWTDTTTFNAEYLARFARTSAAIDAQTMVTGLSLQAAAYKADEFCAPTVLNGVKNLSTYFFYSRVAFHATTGGNLYASYPVLVNNLA